MNRRPPKDDPSRPLYLAMRSARLLGLASASFGLVVVFALGYFNHYRPYRRHFIPLGILVWFGPGVLNLLCALLMAGNLRRRSAVVGAICVCAVQLMEAAALLDACFMFPPVSPVPVLLTLLWIAALLETIVLLWRALRWLRADGEATPGFGVNPVTSPKPVLPVQENEATK